MLVNLPKLGEPIMYSYGYDQLNRLVSTDAYRGLNTSNANWTPINTSDYKERFAYNADGGITNLLRNGANGTVIDNAAWNYYPGTHQLEHINDPAGRHGFDAGQQNVNNYQWNEMGEMTADNERGLTNMDWTVYGKIWHQTMNGTSISYTYDPSGKRLSKTVGGSNGYTEYYVHDAQGNTMAIYKSQNNSLKVSELGLYGSSKLGGWQTGTDVTNPVGIPASGSNRVLTRGQQYFILADYRGNSYVTISDRVIPVSNDGVTIDHKTADVITAQDYSSFGSLLDGRQFGGAPRYTYNGKQLDGETGWQDYGMREYADGFFPTPDPLTDKYPELTPYQFASNTPIQAIDLDGLEAITLSEVADGKMNVVDWINDTKNGALPWFNERFNPLFIANNHILKITKGRDFYGNPNDSRGKLGAVSDAGVDVMAYLTLGKLFGSNTGNALEKEMAFNQNAASPLTKPTTAAKTMTKMEQDLTLTINKSNCFVAGTKVMTRNGLKNIEDIKLGDSVWAYNEYKHKSELKVVEKTFINKTNKLVKLKLNDITVWATPEHPFYIDNKWIGSNQICVGDSVTLFNNRKQVVSNCITNDTLATVYNFTVTELHNYYVSSLGILVHNNCSFAWQNNKAMNDIIGKSIHGDVFNSKGIKIGEVGFELENGIIQPKVLGKNLNNKTIKYIKEVGDKQMKQAGFNADLLTKVNEALNSGFIFPANRLEKLKTMQKILTPPAQK